MNDNKWPCGCGTNLGTIAFGELVVDSANCQAINTEGVNLVLTCVDCGKQKVWFAKHQKVEIAFVDSLSQLIADQVLKRLKKDK